MEPVTEGHAHPSGAPDVSVFMRVCIGQALVLSVVFLFVSMLVFVSSFLLLVLPFNIVIFLFLPLICYVGIFCFYSSQFEFYQEALLIICW